MSLEPLSLTYPDIMESGKNKRFLPSLNYYGSSDTGSLRSMTPTTYGIFGQNPGRYSPRSPLGVRVPFSDKVINPNDPSQRYTPVDIVKSPDIAAAQGDLMKTFRSTAASALGDFNKHLDSFRSELNAAKQAGNAATDINGTVGALTGSLNRYGTNLDQAISGYRNSLDAGAAAARGVVGKEYAYLPQYDAAGQAIADRQMQEAVKQINRYKLGSGTPSSFGSDEQAMLTRAAADVMLPLKQAQIQKRYDIMSGQELPVEQNIANQNIGYFGSFLPGVAGSRYGAETGTAQAIQALKERVAGLSYENATRYLQALGLPAQMQNQILAGQISNLGGLSQIEDQSRYRGLQDILGVNLEQPVSYTQNVPAYPVYPASTRYNLAGNGMGPVQVGPNEGKSNVPGAFQMSKVFDPNTQRWIANPDYVAPVTGTSRYGAVDPWMTDNPMFY